MEVKDAKSVLATMLEDNVDVNTPDFEQAWQTLKAFCLLPVSLYHGYSVDEQFSWEFYLSDLVSETPSYFIAGFCRSMAFNQNEFIEECFCSFYFPYKPELAAFDEPEYVEGYGRNRLLFFEKSETSHGFQVAHASQLIKFELHQAAL